MMDRKQFYTTPLEARRDIAWWARFVETYNGISMIWMHKEPNTDQVIATDACPTGYGGTMGNQDFRGRFAPDLQGKNIAVLEMRTVLGAIRLWAEQVEGKYFWIHVDNEAVAQVLNSGKGRDSDLQNALREIAYITARHQFMLKARHIAGVDNRVPDWLSRWDNQEARRMFREHARDKGLVYKHTSNTLIQFQYKW